MRQLEFEQLVVELMSVLYAVRDERTLLEVASTLLDAKIGILAWVEAPHPITVVASHPIELETISMDEVKGLTDWFSATAAESDFHGFSRNEEIIFRGETYPDALVAFSPRVSRGDHGAPSLILLKNRDTGGSYRSYHCWAASILLRHYEFPKIQEYASRENKSKKNYAAFFITEVLPDEPWDDLKVRADKCQDDITKWCMYILWLGYQERKKSSNKKTTEGYEIAKTFLTQNPNGPFFAVTNFLINKKRHDFLNVLHGLKVNIPHLKPMCWGKRQATDFLGIKNEH